MQRGIVTLGLLCGLAVHAQARVVLQNGTALDGGYTGLEAVSIIGDNVLPWDGGVSYCDTNVVWFTSGTVQMNGLVQWQLTGIPPGSTVTGANVQVSYYYGLYFPTLHRMRRGWNGQSTWFQASNGTPWQTPGAFGPLDSDATPLAILQGPISTAFGDAGIGMVQSWVDAPATNYGIQFRIISPDSYAAMNGTGSSGPPTLFVRGTLPDGGGFDAGFQQNFMPSPAYSGSLSCQLAFGPPASTVNWYRYLLRVSVEARIVVKADLSPVPAWSTIVGGRWLISNRNPGAGSAELFALRRNWVPTEVTWTNASAGVAWQASGVNGATDRDTVVAATGSIGTSQYSGVLNDAGIVEVQRWLEMPSTNMGMLLKGNPPTAPANLLSEALSTLSGRPALELDYFEGRLRTSATNAYLFANSAPATINVLRERVSGLSLPSGIGPIQVQLTAAGPGRLVQPDGGLASQLTITMPANVSTVPVGVALVSGVGAPSTVTVTATPAWQPTSFIIHDLAADAGTDAGTPDSGTPDAGVDAGAPDASSDSGIPDAAVDDAGTPDAGPPDAAVDDAGAPDATVDAGPPDASVIDAGVPNGGTPEGELNVGCDCTAAGPAALGWPLFLMIISRRRIRRNAPT